MYTCDTCELHAFLRPSKKDATTAVYNYYFLVYKCTSSSDQNLKKYACSMNFF